MIRPIQDDKQGPKTSVSNGARVLNTIIDSTDRNPNKIVTIWNPSGSPILPNLLCYEIFAVKHYGYMSHALHLRQTRQSLKLGIIPFKAEFFLSYFSFPTFFSTASKILLFRINCLTASISLCKIRSASRWGKAFLMTV